MTRKTGSKAGKVKGVEATHSYMATFELPGGQNVSVPDGFATAADQFGMTKRMIGVGPGEKPVTVLAPSPMGDLPGQVSSEQLGFGEALRVFAMTPMEPFRLAPESMPAPNPANMSEAMNQAGMPPTIAVPEGAEDMLPFEESWG